MQGTSGPLGRGELFECSVALITQQLPMTFILGNADAAYTWGSGRFPRSCGYHLPSRRLPGSCSRHGHATSRPSAQQAADLSRRVPRTPADSRFAWSIPFGPVQPSELLRPHAAELLGDPLVRRPPAIGAQFVIECALARAPALPDGDLFVTDNLSRKYAATSARVRATPPLGLRTRAWILSRGRRMTAHEAANFQGICARDWAHWPKPGPMFGLLGNTMPLNIPQRLMIAALPALDQLAVLPGPWLLGGPACAKLRGSAAWLS